MTIYEFSYTFGLLSKKKKLYFWLNGCEKDGRCENS